MKLKELLKNLDYKQIENISDCEIKGITCNSQKVAPGDLFVAIKGEKLDGHDFINQAINQGAQAVILQKDLSLTKKIPKILVANTQSVLSSVCAAFFGHPSQKLKVIGITGTCGKTTVSYLIDKIFSCAGLSAGVVGTVNYRIKDKQYYAVNTTPGADILQSLLQEIVLAQAKYAIIEVSSHALTQHRVGHVDFSQAIFTNLSPEHLDYHSNLENYFSSKSILFKGLSAYAWSIINIDDPYGRRLTKLVKSKLLTFGIVRPAQIRAENIKLAIDKLKFSAITPRGKIEIESSLIGRHNVYNILAAIGTAFAEDIDFAHIASGIKDCTYVCGRLEQVNCGQDFLVFIDFAHTEDALKKILVALRQISKNRIILVFGCGGDRDKSKRPKMGKTATALADFVILTCDNPRSEDPKLIVTDIIKGIGKETKNYSVELDRYQAIKEALFKAKRKDIVVIAGKGHESCQIYADKSIPFNDRQVVEEILTNQLTTQRANQPTN